MPADSLSEIMQMVLAEMERYKDKPPAFVVAQAEARIRSSSLAGARIHISRFAKAEALRRVAELDGLSVAQVSERTGYSDRYVRKLRGLLGG